MIKKALSLCCSLALLTTFSPISAQQALVKINFGEKRSSSTEWIQLSSNETILLTAFNQPKSSTNLKVWIQKEGVLTPEVALDLKPNQRIEGKKIQVSDAGKFIYPGKYKITIFCRHHQPSCEGFSSITVTQNK